MAEWDIYTRALEVLERDLCRQHGFDATFHVVRSASEEKEETEAVERDGA